MVRRNVRFIQVFAAFSSRGITHPTALTAALQAIAAFATTRNTTTETSRTAPDNGEDDEPAHNDNTNYWPPAVC